LEIFKLRGRANTDSASKSGLLQKPLFSPEPPILIKVSGIAEKMHGHPRSLIYATSKLLFLIITSRSLWLSDGFSINVEVG
jgi:hypothetical protein